MALTELQLKRSYNSDVNDILEEFYIPVLQESTEYDRVAGFFSSSTLAIAAKGIAGFIKNGGRMRLITSAILQRRDIDAIMNEGWSVYDALEFSLSSSLVKLECGIAKDHVKALAWMIREKLLEIKIAVMIGDDGAPLDVAEVKRRGMVHQKVGIFRDYEGNRIAFDGSINETATAWNLNLEQFKVFREWVPGEKEFFLDDCEVFNSLWQDRAERARVYPVPDAIKRRLVKMAPISIDTLDLGPMPKTPKVRLGGGSNIVLWDHQIEAIKEWFDAKCKGIFAMATGTGKTIAALGCMIRLREREHRLATIISCPQLHLVSQWKNVIKGLGIAAEVVRCDSSEGQWKKQVSDYLLDLDVGIVDNLILITTHDTLVSESFIERVAKTSQSVLLIADEVHGTGTELRSEGLVDKYSYRLGLSATPERPMDPEGTQRIADYFGPVVSEFSIWDAIHTINPRTGKTFLVPYDYFPILVEMTDEEFNGYREISRDIARAYYAAKNDETRREYFKNLCYERARIVNGATNKLDALDGILDELRTEGPIRHTVVYCEGALCAETRRILLGRHLKVRKFTQKEGIRKEKKYDGITEREYILKSFAEGNPEVLTAIKCLDEGVDVPEMRVAIIMASSTNPRQFIQRRGRVLRNAPGKVKAVIYDMVVVPPGFDRLKDKLDAIESRVLRREVTRCRHFAEDASNTEYCKRVLERVEDKLCDGEIADS